MGWGAVFAAFFVSHLAGDYILQTDWQALHKRGGLGRDRDSRRALATHTLTYTIAFIPALVWVSSRLGWNAALIAAVIAVPHLTQDDGRLLQAYARRVKRIDPTQMTTVMLLVDQSFHLVALFGTALLVHALL